MLQIFWDSKPAFRSRRSSPSAVRLPKLISPGIVKRSAYENAGCVVPCGPDFSGVRILLFNSQHTLLDTYSALTRLLLGSCSTSQMTGSHGSASMAETPTSMIRGVTAPFHIRPSINLCCTIRVEMGFQTWS